MFTLLAVLVLMSPMGFLGALADRFDPPVDPFLADPVGWVRDRLGEQIWSKQAAIFESVRDHRRTAVHSCHGAGKSHIAARVAAWWIECHPPGTAFVVTTAPSWPQVKAIVWRYIGKIHRKAHLKGRVNQTEWYLGEELVGFGRKPADEDAEGFQGIHAPFVLVIVDEAGGIPALLWSAVLAVLTTSDCRVLAIGNPDFQGSHFAKMCSPGSGWNVIHIDGLATPNFTDETKPEGAPLLDQSYVDDIVTDFGEDSPQYAIKVRGLFPPDNNDGVIKWSWAYQCRGIDATARVGALRVPIELGVDVGGGGDLTIIRERTGPTVGRRWIVNTDDNAIVEDEIIDAIRITGATMVKMDEGGIGHFIGSLRRRVAAEVSWPCTVKGVQFGGGAKDPKRFVNARAELWWEGRERSQPKSSKAWDLSFDPITKLGADDRTMADLTEPRWFETKDGRIQVEAKDEVRKRLGRSPDDGDALLLAFYDPPIDTSQQAATITNRDRRGFAGY